MTISATVHPRKWIQKPVLHRTDLPPTWFTYPPPQPTPPPSPPGPSSALLPRTLSNPTEDDVIPMSRKALREVLRGFNPADLPPEIASCLESDTQASLADRALFPPPQGLPVPPNGSSDRPTSQNSTPQASYRILSHFPPLDPPREASKSPTPNLHAPQPPPGPQSPLTRATVHRTSLSSGPDNGPLPDLALLLCHQRKDPCIPDVSRSIWDPCTLFPELGSPPKTKAALLTNRTRAHMPAQTAPPKPLHRTNRGRINKKAGSHLGLDKIDAQAFIDVPLQYAEAENILHSIGATAVSIPPHLITDHNRTQPGPTETDPNDPLHPAPNSRPPTRPANLNDATAQESSGHDPADDQALEQENTVHLGDP